MFSGVICFFRGVICCSGGLFAVQEGYMDTQKIAYCSGGLSRGTKIFVDEKCSIIL